MDLSDHYQASEEEIIEKIDELDAKLDLERDEIAENIDAYLSSAMPLDEAGRVILMAHSKGE